MAKISALPVAARLDGSEHLPVVQAGTTRRATLAGFRDMIVPFLQNWYKGDDGPPGPSNNTRATLAALKASAVSDLTSLHDGSLWFWTPGDFTDRADDPDVVEADAVPLAVGAWLRRSQNLLRDTARTFVPRQGDNSAALNALLAQPGVRTVVLPDGVIPVARTVRVPAGKKLALQSTTILRALPDFAIVDGLNHVVLLAGSRAEITGGTVDANKVGLGQGGGARINGITVVDGARDCVRANLAVGNCTGYAVYDAGANHRRTMPSSFNIDLRTFNSQIHYEQQGADGSTYINCHSSDGDGDIPCLSWAHPLFSRNLRFLGCTGYGATPAAVEISANIADCAEISFSDCRYEQTNPGAVSLVITDGYGFRMRGLRATNSQFIAPGGYGAALNDTTGVFSQVEFRGGYGMQVARSDVQFEGCSAICDDDPAGTRALFGIVSTTADNVIQWNGGLIRAIGGPGAGSAPASGPGVTISSITRQLPASDTSFMLRNQARGTAAITPDGADKCFANVFANYADASKVTLLFDLRSKAGDVYSGTAAPRATWREVGAGFLRIRIGGALDPERFEYRWFLIETV